MSKTKKPEGVKPEKKGFSNPALRMMGIPRISLPSRNWMIFWSVLASIGGGIAYDKYQQKQIRKEYMAKVEKLSKEVYESNRLPRKLTIFIAPPPDDFLDKSMAYFKKFIKPVLNAAAIDYDILVASKQGDIRVSVSERIRQLRRDKIEQEKQAQQQQEQLAYDRSWKKFVTATVPGIFKAPFQRKQEQAEEFKSYKDIYEPKDLLGYYFKYDTITPIKDDSLEDINTGGVVCIGRGTYKEFIQGVHEGLLGPLEAPPKVEEVQPEGQEALPVEAEPVESSDFRTEEETKDTNPIVPPFIKTSEYGNAQLAPEFNFDQIIKDNNNVTVLFEQPIYVFPVPNVLGFLNVPKKIYNYFTKRRIAEEFSERTLHIVDNKSRPFEYKDQFLAKEEELLWPKKWVEKGQQKNSEWVQEIVVDDRVANHLRIVD